jgi:thiol-disulfide isomerase/thioredoxin
MTLTQGQVNMRVPRKAAWTLLIVFFALVPVRADVSQLEPRQLWPAVSLQLPSDPVLRHYLGVKEGETFTVDDMASDVVVVEIFNMYCPFCQREASHVNELFALVDRRDDLNRKLKIIGIGVGNSNFEVDFYRRSYSVQFPLFADKDFEIYEKVGKVRTPCFFILKRDARGRFRVAFVHSGGFKTPEAFLKEIIRRSGLEVIRKN